MKDRLYDIQGLVNQVCNYFIGNGVFFLFNGVHASYADIGRNSSVCSIAY